MLELDLMLARRQEVTMNLESVVNLYARGGRSSPRCFKLS